MDKQTKIYGMQGVVFVFMIIFLFLQVCGVINEETLMNLGFGSVLAFGFYALKVARS